MLVRQGTNTIIETDARELEEEGRDTCPVLGEQEIPDTRHGIRDVRRIDYSGSSPKRNFAQRIQSRKNRFIQRMLVACHLADPSRDLTFKQEQASNSLAIEKLIAIRRSIFAHSQCVVNLSTAISWFTGSSALSYDDSQHALANVAGEGSLIREYSLVLSDQVEKVILTRIDHEIAERERIHSLIEERAKLVLDVEYAKRMLALEQQKGNFNRIGDCQQALQTAQHECKQATRFILDQLKIVCPHRDSDVPKLLQEYAKLVAEFFMRGTKLVNGPVPSN